MTFLDRLKDVVVHRILGVADTPHRIAWGVYLGFLIAITPTFGIQIMLYVAAATLLRANKVSGVPILFITNPVTLVPVYYCAWWVGSLLVSRAEELTEPVFPEALRSPGDATWAQIGEAVLDVGAELWVGSLLIGVVGGAISYAAAYWGVLAFRRSRAALDEPPATG